MQNHSDANVKLLRLGCKTAPTYANIRINGAASLANVIFSNDEITEYRGLASSHEEFNSLLSMCLLNRGVFIAPSALFCLSTVMSEKEIDSCIKITEECFTELAPVIEETAPALMR